MPTDPVADQPTLPPPAALDPGLTVDIAPPTAGDAATLPPPGANGADGSAAPDAPPGYVIDRELGRGGMGVVYLARQVGLNRPVALKMVLSGSHAAPQERVRFLAEAEAIAALRHPHVVQIFEVGTHAGRPYFTLEFCDGGGLDKALADHPLPAREAAAVVEQVCRGVQAAHELGIIHRDLKPQNVLLAGGVPKVTDFGLAKRAGSDLTATGAVMGTPSYMAPEQAAGKGKEAGPASDVYALGAILYECLTGRPPFRAATPLDTMLQVLADDPVPPTRLAPKTPPDLETVCLKCMHKDPARRYPSAAALADDLTRFMAGEPVTARPVGRVERGWKWVRRNRATATAVAAVAAALVLGTAVAVWQAVRASDEATRAEGLAGIATARAAEAKAAEGRADERAADAKAQEATARAEQKRAEQALADLKAERGQSADFRYASRINRAYAEWHALNGFHSRTILEACPPELRGWEWGFLDRLFDHSSTPLRGHAGNVRGAVGTPDGRRVVTVAGGNDKTVRVWDARTGIEERVIPVDGYRLAARPGGAAVAVAVNGGLVKLIDPDSGKELRSERTGVLVALAFVRGGKELVTVGLDGTVVFRDPDTLAERSRGKRRLTIDPDVQGLLARGIGGAVSPDGRLVTCAGDKLVVWAAATGEVVMTAESHLKGVGQPAFRPDGKALATPGFDGTVKVWDLETKREVRTLRGHKAPVWTAAYSPDGRTLLTGSRDATARLWNPDTGETRLTFVGHQSEVWAVGFTGDGASALTGSPDQSARVWSADTKVTFGRHVVAGLAKQKLPEPTAGSGEHLTFYGHLGPVRAIALSPDGKWLASATMTGEESDHRITVWDVDARAEALKLPAAKDQLQQVAFTADGKHLLVGHVDGADKPARVAAYPVPSAAPAWTWTGPPCKESALTLSPDGRTLAVAVGTGKDTVLALLDPATGAERSRRVVPGPHLLAGFSPDDREVVLVGLKGTMVAAKVLAAAGTDPAPVREWVVTSAGVSAAAVSKAGVLATAEMSGTGLIKTWDLRTGRELLPLEGHAGAVNRVAFNPDGSRLLTTATDFTARVWNVDTGLELLTFRDHTDVPLWADWSRDGSRLATACVDGAVRVWQGPPADAVIDGWPVVFRDDFDRPELGGGYFPVQGQGRWGVKDGAARGALEARPGRPPIATLMVGVTLPRAADIRFRVRTAVPMVANPVLTDETGVRLMYAPILAGACQAPGSPFAALTQIAIRDGQVASSPVGMPRRFDLKPGRWYAVRVVREPERLRVWVDGRPVLAERIPDVDLPKLALQGGFAAAGDAIEFDDLEVRAPADAVRAHAVRGKVRAVFAKVKVRDEARRVLAADPEVTPADKATVEAALGQLTEDPAGLEAVAWEGAIKPKATAEEYRLVRVWAEAADKARPDSADNRATLALAHLRADDPAAAVRAAAAAIPLFRRTYGAPWPVLHGVLAVGHRRLGRPAEAAEAADHLARMRVLMLGDRWANDPVAKGLAAEAEAEVGPAARLDPTAEAITRRIISTETAGWLRHDLAAYLDLYPPDCTGRSGRTAAPDRRDFALTGPQLAAVRRIQFRTPPAPPSTWFSYEDVDVKVSGEEAEWTARSTVHFGDDHDTYGVVYRLRKGSADWQVRDVRSWLIARRRAGVREELTPEYWAAKDATADKPGDPAARVAALKEARRFAEALTAAKAATAGPSTAALWAERGDLHFELGDVPAALHAFRTAERLDPDVQLPWYMNRARAVFTGHLKGVVGGAAFTPAGDRVVTAGNVDGMIRTWDAATGVVGPTVTGVDASLGAVAFSPDGKLFAVAGTTTVVYDAAALKPVVTCKGHTAKALRVAWSRDGGRLVTAGADGTARVWEAATGKELARFDGHGRKRVLGAEFTPDGSAIVSCGDDQVARLWEVATRREIRPFADHTAGVNRAVLSPDGRLLATVSSDKSVRVWEVDTGKQLRQLDGHDQPVDAAAFSPDGGTLATGDHGGAVRLWDPATGRKRLTLPGGPGAVFALAFRPDGRAVVAAGAGGATVFDIGPHDAGP